MITEPDVTFTDYGLAIECALFSYLLCRRGNRHQPLRSWFVLFFASTSVAALTGGTVHGFFLDVRTTGYIILWPMTLVTIGITALVTWAIGAKIMFSGRIAHWILTLAAVEFAGYCIVVLFMIQTFRVAVLSYLPATTFLFATLAIAYHRVRRREVLAILAGLLLTLVAAGVQTARLTPHPVYFNHNALYHSIQAAAMFMIFYGARWLMGSARGNLHFEP